MPQDIAYMWNPKSDRNELIYKIEIDSQMKKTNLWLPKREVGGGINYEFGINKYTLLYIKLIKKNKDLLYSMRLYSISCNNLQKKP